MTTKTYDEPVTFCHRCGMFNDEAKKVKRNNIIDATISTSVSREASSIVHKCIRCLISLVVLSAATFLRS